MMTLQVVSGLLLIFFGLLLGTSWTIQALQSKLRHQAEEHRRLNEEWLAVRNARRKQGECGYCVSHGQDWYVALTVAKERLDSD